MFKGPNIEQFSKNVSEYKKQFSWGSFAQNIEEIISS